MLTFSNETIFFTAVSKGSLLLFLYRVPLAVEGSNFSKWKNPLTCRFQSKNIHQFFLKKSIDCEYLKSNYTFKVMFYLAKSTL